MIDGRLIRRESGITSTARTKSRINVQEIEGNYHEQNRKIPKNGREHKKEKEKTERRKREPTSKKGKRGNNERKKNMYVVYKSPATWYTQGRSRHKHL